MAWLAVDLDDYEYIFDLKPKGDSDGWLVAEGQSIQLPYGTIEKLTGIQPFYLDEPIELKAAE